MPNDFPNILMGQYTANPLILILRLALITSLLDVVVSKQQYKYHTKNKSEEKRMKETRRKTEHRNKGEKKYLSS